MNSDVGQTLHKSHNITTTKTFNTQQFFLVFCEPVYVHTYNGPFLADQIFVTSNKVSNQNKSFSNDLHYVRTVHCVLRGP